jgi:hypothetical protein
MARLLGICRLLAVGALALSPALATAAQAPEPDQPASGSVAGIVTDDTGAPIPGAALSLSQEGALTSVNGATDADGRFVFSRVPAGSFQLVVSSPGFAERTASGIVPAGERLNLAAIRLTVANAAISIDVTPASVIADRQVKEAEQQRALGFLPNYLVAYGDSSAPLSPGQKFELSRKAVFDPADFAVSGLVAGIQHARDDFTEFGGGVSGYGKRYAAFYATIVTRSMVQNVLLPVVLKQDPRYFFKGTGSRTERALYAIGTAVLRKGDSGRWQPNYSGILGSVATGALTNLYYPSEHRRGVGLTLQYTAIGILGAATGHLAQEFVLHRLTTRAKPAARGAHTSHGEPVS